MEEPAIEIQSLCKLLPTRTANKHVHAKVVCANSLSRLFGVLNHIGQSSLCAGENLQANHTQNRIMVEVNVVN